MKEVTVIDANAYEQSSTVADTWWLRELDLCQSDKELIISNKWLSAPIIAAAHDQMILSKQIEDVFKRRLSLFYGRWGRLNSKAVDRR